MTKVKCSSCGQKTALVTTKGNLEKITGTQVPSTAGKIEITPEVLKGLIDLFKTIFNKIFGWYEDNNQKYIICENCGFCEKLDE